MKTIILYRASNNKEPFGVWLAGIKDSVLRYRTQARLRRVEQGNFGDHKRFSGILELRIDCGKGYRVYCGEDGAALVVLLAGGDKSTQEKDIRKAVSYWEDYHAQKKNENIR